MRKLLIIILLLFSFNAFGQVYFSGMQNKANPFINRIVQTGASPSNERIALVTQVYNMFLDSLNIDSLRQKFDFLYFLDYGDSSVAKLNWVRDTMNITVYGQVYWDSSGVISSGYGDLTDYSHLILNDSITLTSNKNIQKNSHSIGCYSKSQVSTAGSDFYEIVSANPYIALHHNNSNNFWSNWISVNTGTKTTGILGYSRISSDSVRIYLDTLIATIYIVSQNQVPKNLKAIQSSKKIISFIWGGTQLSSEEIRKIKNIYEYWWTNKNATESFTYTGKYLWKIQLPDTVYMATNQTYNMFWNNIYNGYNYSDFTYSVVCDSGIVSDSCFTITPTSAQKLNFKVKIYNSLSQLIDEDSTILSVAVPISDTVKMMFIGNSLTNSRVYIRNTMTLSGGLIDTVKVLYNSEYKTLGRDITSPLKKDGKVDILAYLSDSIDVPDYITIELGTNDIGRCGYSTYISYLTTTLIGDLDSLINNFTTALPSVKIGVGFVQLQKIGWENIYFRKAITNWYNLRLLKKYQDSPVNRVSLIPYHLGIDPVNEMTDIHPNDAGYLSMAKYWWGWLCNH